MKHVITLFTVFYFSAEMFAIGRQDTTEATRARIRSAASKVMQLGGLVERPGYGKLALVSVQKTYSSGELTALAGLFSSQLHFKINVLNTEQQITTGNAIKAMKEIGLSVGIFLVDDARLPLTLVAAEEGWAIINATKIAEGATDNKAKALRLQRALSRTFKSIFLNGSTDKGGKAVRSAADLEKIARDPIDGQQLFTIVRSMPSYGLVASRLVPYKLACQQGWAPEPTNDVQKAVWNEVHSIPANPMKIKYQPKK